MEDLFLRSYPAHFGLSAASTTHFTLTTNAAYFEVEDDANRELVLHTTQGMGMARFTNPGQLAVTIVNYDKFLTSLPPKFQEGRKRCDLILCSELDRYFILGELKDRVYHKKNRSKAKKQLIASLQTILEVAELNSLAASKAERMCCYFNKQSEAPAILSVTTAFNRLSALHPDGFRMESIPIEALGFAFYEYTGTQTAHLLASPVVAVLPAP